MGGYSSRYNFAYARYPAVRLLICYAIGILLYHFVRLSDSHIAFILLIITSLYLVINHLYLHYFHKTWQILSLILYFFLIAGFGFFRTSLKKSSRVLPSHELYAFKSDTIYCFGEIQKVDPGPYRIRYTALLDSVFIKNKLTVTGPFHVIIDQDNTTDLIDAGSRLSFTGIPKPIYPRRNPHDFDYRAYLRRKGIGAEIDLISIESVSANSDLWNWIVLRRRLDKAIDHVFDPENRPVAKALLIGQKGELTKNTRQSFVRAGLSHLMAVSGLHVGFLIAPLWFLIPLVWTTKIGRILAIVSLAIILFIYSGLTGFPASVMRASLMAILFAYGRIFRKVREPLNLLACAAIIILVINPNRLYDIGFQLSFSAVAIILLIMPTVNRLLMILHSKNWIHKVTEGAIVSLIVQIGLLPLLASYFHEYSLIAPISNIIAIPLAQVIVLGGFFSSILTLFWPTAGIIFGVPINFVTGWLNSWAGYMSGLPGSWINIPDISPVWFLVWISAIGCIAAYANPRLRWKWLGIIILATALFPASDLLNHKRTTALNVTFFDVGQGDASLIDTPGGHHFLVDTGRWMWHTDSGKRVIVPELKARGINHLDAVFLTHPQADHIGGILSIMQAVRIDTIYNIGQPYDSKLFTHYHELAKERNVPLKRLFAGELVFVDPGIRLYVLAPELHAHNSNVNDLSLMLKLVYGKTSFLFTGDAEQPEEEAVANDFNTFLNSDVLKVGHHGSATSSTKPFLDLVTPNVGVVSVGNHNRYGHPDYPVVKRLLHDHAHLHYTALEGAVSISSDGTHVSVKHWK